MSQTAFYGDIVVSQGAYHPTDDSEITLHNILLGAVEKVFTY